MQTRGSSSSNKDANEHTNKDAAEKKKLLQEIQELKCLIKQCKWDLQTLRFKDVEEQVIERSKQNPEVSLHSRKPLNVEIDLQYDLYKFGGFYCVKFVRDEFVFNFTSTNEEKDIHALQFFIKDKKGKLGKWVMPMSIDINYLLSKTPIDELKNLTPFMKSCKHNVDCYHVRQEQFLSLKEHVSNVKNCNLQSDIGFQHINLELYGVHDSENDIYMNLVIYLLYYSDKARPYKVEVDTINKNKLSDDTRQKLKACLKEFKISDLKTAFTKILTEDNSIFTWTKADDSDESPLEINDTSSSDGEDFLLQLQLDQKRVLRKRKKRRDLLKKWNERKKQRKITTVGSSEDDDTQEESRSKSKVSRTKSPREILTKKKKAEKATSILEQKKINKNLPEETPLHKRKVKLKQTKLNFQAQETMSSKTNEKSLFESKFRNIPSNMKLITSTPLNCRVNIAKLPSSPNLETNNITFIETLKKRANKSDDSKNCVKPENKTPEKKAQETNSRLLRSNITATRLTSQNLKTNQHFTRSMKILE